MTIKGKTNILARAKVIANGSTITNGQMMFLMVRDQLSDEGVRRDALTDCYYGKRGVYNGELYEAGMDSVRNNIAKARAERLELEAKALVEQEKLREIAEQQRLDYYHSADAQQVSIHRGDVVVNNGRVESVTEVSFGDFSQGATADWTGYYSYGLSGGKVCQVIKLKDCDKEFRLVLGKASTGAREFDVLDFSATVSESDDKVIELERSKIQGLGCFNISKPITVHNKWYPSIMAAYRTLSPMISYSYITQLISKGDCPSKTFNRTTTKRQAVGSMTRHAIA